MLIVIRTLRRVYDPPEAARRMPDARWAAVRMRVQEVRGCRKEEVMARWSMEARRRLVKEES